MCSKRANILGEVKLRIRHREYGAQCQPETPETSNYVNKRTKGLSRGRNFDETGNDVTFERRYIDCCIYKLSIHRIFILTGLDWFNKCSKEY